MNSEPTARCHEAFSEYLAGLDESERAVIVEVGDAFKEVLFQFFAAGFSRGGPVALEMLTRKFGESS